MTFALGMLNVLGTANANDLPGCSKNVSPTIATVDGEMMLPARYVDSSRLTSRSMQQFSLPVAMALQRLVAGGGGGEERRPPLPHLELIAMQQPLYLACC